jgi:hypothetical protein
MISTYRVLNCTNGKFWYRWISIHICSSKAGVSYLSCARCSGKQLRKGKPDSTCLWTPKVLWVLVCNTFLP